MRTKNFLKHLILGALLLTIGKVVGQTSVVGNSGGVTDFLGWDNTVTNNFPLMVRHDLNQPIEFYTETDERMTISPIRTGQTINAYTNLDLTGFVGVGDFYTNTNIFRHPVARVHAENGASTEEGYRPMLGEGFLATRGESLFYGGLLDGLEGGVVWARKRAPGFPTAPLRFIYTGTDGTSTVSAGADGLELGRFQPDVSLDEGYFGVGDWTTIAPLLPDERLDLADQTIRLRNFMDPLPSYLTTSYENDALTRAVVVDPADGRLYWRELPGSLGDCEWRMNTSTPHHVYTAVGASDPDCPDRFESVGIGVDLSITTAQAKLEVSKVDHGTAVLITDHAPDADVRGVQVDVMNGTTSNRGFSAEVVADGNAINYGLRADVSGSTVRSRGVSAQTNGASYTAYAGEFLADDEAQFTTGVIGWARGGGLRVGSDGRALGSKSTYQIGVQGLAFPDPGCEDMAPLLNAEYIGVSGIACREDDDPTIVGVYGRTMDNGGGTWAGYFDGHVNITGLAFCTLMQWGSDADLKTDVQDITGALGLIDQLRPTTYLFDTVAHPALDLPGGLQRGFIAQEVEQVLPDLVREATYLGRSDSLGNALLADETVKTVNYIGFIPLLVAAMQEQQATISSLQDQLAAVQQDLASCCAFPGDTDQRSMSTGAGAGAGTGQDLRTDLHIIPNPVADLTQLRYTVAAPGRTRLEVSDASGKRLEVLEEAVREVGSYSHAWNTTDLAPGTYHCTLYLNDSFVVKKAVKVAR
ncbi:MAG: tail fiber domain-containing protein [Flavobacteriales bacterium]|nr:tail fiber domain-containing protein [Flavobacteriales bacterium]